jgi:hypothetical protein
VLVSQAIGEVARIVPEHLDRNAEVEREDAGERRHRHAVLVRGWHGTILAVMVSRATGGDSGPVHSVQS